MKRFWMGLPAIALVLSMLVFGCATHTSSSKATNFDKHTMNLTTAPKYTVLGAITLEKNWFGILGFTIFGRSTGHDFYIYQSGGITYVDLLAETKKQYPDADAVIDIKVDHSGDHYWIFYGNRKNIISGIAIKYSREEVVLPPHTNVYIHGEKK
jgi:hypothetical protein